MEVHDRLVKWYQDTIVTFVRNYATSGSDDVSIQEMAATVLNRENLVENFLAVSGRGRKKVSDVTELFEKYLENLTRKYVESVKAESRNTTEFDPIHLDAIEVILDIRCLDKGRVYDQFIKEYGALVVHLVQRHNKVTANFRTRDIIQEIFLQCKSGRLIERFLEQAHYTVPEVITGEQAYRALGITWAQFSQILTGFKVLEAKGTTEPLTLPVEGDVSSKKATYQLKDIMALSIRVTGAAMDTACLVPKATRKHFQNYVSKTVSNRFANYCRTEERHHKERVWDTFPELRPMTDEPTSWENRLADKTPASQEASAELGLLVRQLNRTPAGKQKDALFTLLSEGYDLEEAINRLEMAPHDKRKTCRILEPWISLILEKNTRRRTTPTNDFSELAIDG